MACRRIVPLARWLIVLPLVACGSDDGGNGDATGTGSDGGASTTSAPDDGSDGGGPTTDGSSSTSSTGQSSGDDSSATSSDGGSSSTSATSGTSGTGDGGSTTSTTTTSGAACNDDGTCDPGEGVGDCPADCTPPDPPAWCDSQYFGCGDAPLGPGVHHDVCVQIEEGRWTSNPTYMVIQRQYSIAIPDAYDGSEAVPLYMWLHPSDVAGDPSLISMYTDALETPDAMASPNDTGAIWIAPISEDNWSGPDWSFAWQALRTVACIYNIDETRMYVGGFGSGGSTAILLGYKPTGDDGFGPDTLAGIAAHSMGNAPGTLTGIDPCSLSREVPTFLARGNALDINRGKVDAWETELLGCWDAANVTKFQYTGNRWLPETFGQQEWPWLSQFTFP